MTLLCIIIIITIIYIIHYYYYYYLYYSLLLLLSFILFIIIITIIYIIHYYYCFFISVKHHRYYEVYGLFVEFMDHSFSLKVTLCVICGFSRYLLLLFIVFIVISVTCVIYCWLAFDQQCNHYLMCHHYHFQLIDLMTGMDTKSGRLTCQWLHSIVSLCYAYRANSSQWKAL